MGEKPCKKTGRILVLLYLFLFLSPSIHAALRISVANEPPTLDWNLATDNVSYQILNNLMEGLTQYDEALNPIPALAESWNISPDKKTYTFNIRKDVRWSDGTPLLAKHFYDSWIRLLDPRTAAEYAYFLYDIQGAMDFNQGLTSDPKKIAMRVLDSHKLQVTLWHPAVYFPAITTFMVTFPIRLDLIEKFGNLWTEPPNMVTLGPFTLKSWRHEYKLILQKNENFYGEEKPELSQLIIYIINEGTTALSLYETNGLDVVELPPIAIPHYRNRSDFRTQARLRGYYYGFNLLKKPFDDVRVRKAFSYAIDRKQFPIILKGGEIPTGSWVPPGMFGFNDQIGIRYDPQKAKVLLTKAGYPNGENFPRIIAAFNTDPLNKIVAENLQAQWKRELGVDILLDNQEWKVYLKNLQHDTPKLFRLGWGADYPDPDNFLNLFTSTSGNNHTGWKNKRYDNLIQIAAAEANKQKRKSDYDEAQKLLTEIDVPIMPLFVVSTNYLAKPYLKNLRQNPLGFIYWKKVARKTSGPISKSDPSKTIQ